MYRIPERNWGELNARIDKLARRAGKLNLSPPRLDVVHVEDVEMAYCLTVDGTRGRVPAASCNANWPSLGPAGFDRFYHVTLVGQAPTIPGWKLVAVVEHGDTEVGNVVRAAPDVTCPPQYRTAPPLCQHCNSVRRRLETFILVDPQGQHQQVGRNCLADFCRDASAAAGLCSFAEIIASVRGLCEGSEDDDFFGMGGRAVERAGIESVLAMTSRIIRHMGWCSRGEARKAGERGENKQATANVVEGVFFDRDFFKSDGRTSPSRRALQDAARDVQDPDRWAAHAALEWVRSMRPDAERLDDYLYNCLVVATEETVAKKHFGIACSIVSSHQRHLGQAEERRQQERQKAASTHVGEVGKRTRMKARLLSCKAFQGEGHGYNDAEPRFLQRFAVDGDNLAVWWTGKEPELKQGEECVLVCTVKSHDEYKGTKQTTLTRCQVYSSGDVGKCPNCGGVVLRCDLGKSCPSCKKRGVKVKEGWLCGISTTSC